jgi:hypothetical protein
MLRDFTRLLFALINFGDFFAPLWIAPEDSIMLEQSRSKELDIDAKEATGEDSDSHSDDF